jgi:hypothetical protein
MGVMVDGLMRCCSYTRKLRRTSDLFNKIADVACCLLGLELTTFIFPRTQNSEQMVKLGGSARTCPSKIHDHCSVAERFILGIP